MLNGILTFFFSHSPHFTLARVPNSNVRGGPAKNDYQIFSENNETSYDQLPAEIRKKVEKARLERYKIDANWPTFIKIINLVFKKHFTTGLKDTAYIKSRRCAPQHAYEQACT
jgi:hypothetical protein